MKSQKVMTMAVPGLVGKTKHNDCTGLPPIH
jgi:hypothetical protein